MDFKRYELWEVTKDLTATAMGFIPADTVIKNAKLINVNTKEIIECTDIAITKGRIALVGNASHTIGKNTKVIDGTGYYASPGFIDTHIHVESSMLSVKEYARCVVPCGTTTIFMDPHEIANVLGIKGMELMINDGKNLPLRVYATVPSCVPACPGFEDTGASINADDIREAMKIDEVKGLGEMMNFPGVLYNDNNIHNELIETMKANKVITGHYSIPDTDKGLNAYIASGIKCCHESVRKEDALWKMRLGMYAQMREGSAWHDLKETVRSITENNIDTRFAVLISDDTHPNTLLKQGHLDHIVNRAIEEGVDPITAIQMVTINAAFCFEMQNDIGSISPGKIADILLISNLNKVKVDKVIFNGELVYENKKILVDIEKSNYPDFAKNTMKLHKKLEASDFIVKCTKDKVKIRVIEIIEAKVGTIHRIIETQTIDGEIKTDIKNDICKAIVVERHKATGKVGIGFVKGFGFKSGAVASTVSHDAHNLLIVGTNDEDMAIAGNALAECGGGMVVVNEGKIIALNPLIIAGLMSEDSAEEVSSRLQKIEEGWKELGCNLISPFMTNALLALAVLPELRLTNNGYVDTVNFKFVDLVVA